MGVGGGISTAADAATHVQVYAYRNLGTGNMVVRVDNIAWRSLLGAPT